MKISLPPIKVNGVDVTVICNTNDKQSFDLWERLAAIHHPQEQSITDKNLINNINKNSKNEK